MLTTITWIGLVLLVIVVAILGYAATKPDDFRVQRSLPIKAPPERIFALINDFRAWSAWSPWEKKDLAMKRTLSGAASGKGAVYGWEGDKNVGTGRMEIMEAITPSRIVIKLDFLKPFEAHNTAEFTMTPSGDTTNVIWAMYGPSPYMVKVMGVFMSMDAMVGKDFEAGLANLKAAAER